MIRVISSVFCGVCLFLVLGLSACQKEDEMRDLSGVVMIELREVSVDAERKIALYAESREIYPCLNFFIDYEVSKLHSHTYVHFKGLQVPKICLTALGPAKALIHLGAMEPGKHPVDFLLNEDGLGTLFHVSEEHLQVETESGNAEYLEFLELEMHRLSDNRFWGYIQVLQTAPDKGTEAFLNDLWAAGAQPVSYDPGNYGFFRIKGDDTILFDGIHHRNVKNPLLFAFDGDVETLKEIADDYKENLAVSFSNPRGEHYHNQR